MRLIKDVPSTVLRMAVFKLLKEGQTIPIHGSVPKGAKLPYITLGAATFKVNCRIGSLESKICQPLIRFFVNCRIGSLESLPS